MHFDSTAPRTTDDTLQGSWRTAASPPDFAPPVAADDDGSALVMVFDMQNLDMSKLAVEVTESAVILHGDTTPSAPRGEGAIKRYFALPPGMDLTTTETKFDGQHLFIRITRPVIDVELDEDDGDDGPDLLAEGRVMVAIRATTRMHGWPYTVRKTKRARRRGQA